MSEIPESILTAVSVMLKPYGVNADDVFRKRGAHVGRYMTVRQASLYCGLTPKTIRKKVLAGEISGMKLGDSDKSRVMIARDDLDKWLESFRPKKTTT